MGSNKSEYCKYYNKKKRTCELGCDYEGVYKGEFCVAVIDGELSQKEQKYCTCYK